MLPMDIAIAGAGPAGLATALFLRRDGHRVTLFERFSEPRPIGSGLIVQPTGQKVLAALGALDALSARSARIERLHGVDGLSGRAVLDVRYADGPEKTPGLGVHRAALFEALFAEVRREDIAIETGFEVERLEDTGDGVRLADLTGHKSGRFDLAIDASGRRSPLKRFAHELVHAAPLDWGALWTTVRADDDVVDPLALQQHYRRANVMIGVLPLGDALGDGVNRAALFWSVHTGEIDKVRERGLEALKADILTHWPTLSPLTDQIDDFDQFTPAHYNHHTLPIPAGRRLAVIGDAAHSTSPQLGQGANMALIDAAALTAALRHAKDLDAALDLYALLRRRHVRVFQMFSMWLTPFYQSDSRILPILRDRLVALEGVLPPVRSMLARLASGTLVDPFARFTPDGRLIRG